MIQCSWCGASNPDESRFCSACGKDVTVPKPEPKVVEPQVVIDQAVSPQDKELAEKAKTQNVIWLVLNIISSLMGCCFVLPLVFGIIGIVFSSQGLSLSKTNVLASKAKAKTAMIMFIVGISIAVLSWIIYLIVIVLVGSAGFLDSLSSGYYY